MAINVRKYPKGINHSENKTFILNSENNEKYKVKILNLIESTKNFSLSKYCSIKNRK